MPHPVSPVLATVVLLVASGMQSTSSELAFGHVEGRRYIDERFGLVYKIPDGLEVQKHLGSTSFGDGSREGPLEYLFAAMAPENGRVRKGVLIVSDPVGTFGTSDTETHMARLLIQSMHPQTTPSITSTKVGDRTFERAHVGFGGQVRSYGVQLSAKCGSLFITFMFSGPSQEEVDELSHSMESMQMTCPNRH